MNSRTRTGPARRRWIRPALAGLALLVAGGAAATTLPATASTVPAVEANLTLRNDQSVLLSPTWAFLSIDVVNDGPDAVAEGDGPAFTATFTLPRGWSLDDCAPISDTRCVIDGPASLASGSTHPIRRTLTTPAGSVGAVVLDITARAGVTDATRDHSNQKDWLVTMLQF